ncbi:MAG TPA: hypothetical protein VF770_03640 [Solirubrobacterales bacterium]
MSRLRTLLALTTLLALATALAACGSSGSNNNEDPHKVIDNATLKGITSGNVNLSLSVKAKGKEGGDINVSLAGPFQSEGKGKLPQLDMTAKANGSINGKNVDFEGGLILLPNSAYVNYKGVEYEVDPTTFSFVKSAIKQAQQQAGGKEGAAGSSACQEAAGKLKISEFIENLSNEGSADVGGTSTTKVSGDLNVAGAIDAFVKLAENPACAGPLGATGALPSLGSLGKAKGKVEQAIKAAHVDVYVGGDHIVRRVTVQLTVEPPKGSGTGPESVELGFDLSLSGVNQKQTIEAPQGAKPLNDLFLKLGVNPVELLGKGGGGAAGGLGGLLKGLGTSSGEGTSKGEGPAATMKVVPKTSGSPSAGAQQEYLKCLQGAKTPVDLQKCAAMLKK